MSFFLNSWYAVKIVKFLILFSMYVDSVITDFSMRVFVFFGLRHFVRRCCAVSSYEFIWFLRPELFFQWECLFFWLQAFCKTVLCRFFIWIYRVFKTSCFFNEGVCFFGFRHFVRRCCAVFSYEFLVFSRPELFFQWECLFFWPRAFCKTVLCHFFIWNDSVFKTRIVFSMRVFVFLASGIL